MVNAVYHRSYQDQSPVEVRVFPSRIEIISYPGPLPPLNKDNLMSGRVVARKYRNRRIGDFLKELHLTEGRGTGFPRIRKALKANDSPVPLFETDDERSYFTTILYMHPEAKIKAQVSEQVVNILKFCITPKKRQEILHYINLSPAYMNYKRHILPLINNNFLAFTVPDKPKSRFQKYKITEVGKALLD